MNAQCNFCQFQLWMIPLRKYPVWQITSTLTPCSTSVLKFKETSFFVKCPPPPSKGRLGNLHPRALDKKRQMFNHVLVLVKMGFFGKWVFERCSPTKFWTNIECIKMRCFKNLDQFS